MKALTKPKSSLTTLRGAMGATERKPMILFSQGRGPRKDHGSRLAATGTPNRRYSGAADNHGADNATIPNARGDGPAGSSGGSTAGR